MFRQLLYSFHQFDGRRLHLRIEAILQDLKDGDICVFSYGFHYWLIFYIKNTLVIYLYEQEVFIFVETVVFYWLKYRKHSFDETFSLLF
jgi:hypothetical protein